MEIAPSAQVTDEHLLLSQLRQGQAAAYESIMRRYNRRLFRAARGILDDDAEAQDAVQEGYLRAFVSLHNFRGEASLGTWLTRIVVNQALSRQRKLGRVVSWDDAHLGEDEAMPPTEEFAPASETPEEALVRSQVRNTLQRAVELLPPIYRSVFILRAVEGLSVEETADALDVTNDVVKTRYLRARGLLRQSLDAALQQEAAQLYQFQGQQCDVVVASTLAALRSIGLIRDH